jgi:hypothetical protein
VNDFGQVHVLGLGPFDLLHLFLLLRQQHLLFAYLLRALLLPSNYALVEQSVVELHFPFHGGSDRHSAEQILHAVGLGVSSGLGKEMDELAHERNEVNDVLSFLVCL